MKKVIIICDKCADEIKSNPSPLEVQIHFNPDKKILHFCDNCFSPIKKFFKRKEE